MSNSYKTILIGDSNVGKTNLKNRFIEDRFGPPYETTIGCSFDVKMFDLNGKKLKLQIWDTGGEARFNVLPPIYFRNAVGALLVYDVTRRESFKNLAKWLEQLREMSHSKISIVLVGNKSDMGEERVVSFEEGEKFAKENGLVFFETSSKIDEKVTEIPIKPFGPRYDPPDHGNCAC